MECAGRHSNALERSDELPDELVSKKYCNNKIKQ